MFHMSAAAELNSGQSNQKTEAFTAEFAER